jgi:hypothetical protein
MRSERPNHLYTIQSLSDVGTVKEEEMHSRHRAGYDRGDHRGGYAS